MAREAGHWGVPLTLEYRTAARFGLENLRLNEQAPALEGGLWRQVHTGPQAGGSIDPVDIESVVREAVDMPSMSRTRLPVDPQPGVFLGRAVRARRTQLGLSQEKLAGASGLDRSFVGQIDRGERNVTIPTLLRIALALDTTPGTLIDAAHAELREANPWYDEAVRRGSVETER